MRAERNPTSISLVAVTKHQPTAHIQEAAGAGLAVFCESRLQEAQEKLPALKQLGEWHFIGHLQTNKARQVTELFDVIQSVDSLRLAEILSQAASALGKKLRIYAQVNISSEPQKYGFRSDQRDAIAALQKMPGLELEGLMGIAAQGANEATRSSFRSLRELRDNLRPRLGDLKLSMGMSQDFEIAIEERADLIRIGTAIFEHNT